MTKAEYISYFEDFWNNIKSHDQTIIRFRKFIQDEVDEQIANGILLTNKRLKAKKYDLGGRNSQ